MQEAHTQALGERWVSQNESWMKGKHALMGKIMAPKADPLIAIPPIMAFLSLK